MAGPGSQVSWQRLRSWAAGASAGAQAAAALSERVAGLTSTADALDGAVRVRVDAAGRLVDLELGEAARQVPAAELAAVVLHAVGVAQHGLTALVTQAVSATVGVSSQTGQAVVDSFAAQYPDPPPEADPLPEAGPPGVDQWARDEDWLEGDPR